jgi:hypothetical protein
MPFRQDVFPLSELVKVPDPKRPVVFVCGGPIMELECIEGTQALCSWEEGGKVHRLLFETAVLFECKRLVTRPGDPA